MPKPPKKLLEQVRDIIRLKHYSYKTEKSYVNWIKRYIFHNKQPFPNLLLDMQDYELAAEYFNICRRRGIQGANTDFLICATANRRNYQILTTDKDFIGFSQYLPIVLTKM